MFTRFIAIISAFVLSFIISVPVFAAKNSKVDYMNYDFPEDAKVLYQGEDGVIYQSKEGSKFQKGAASVEYNYAWLNPGVNTMGSFNITNPHPLGGTTNGTFKIESDYSGASAEMILSSALFAYADITLSASDGDVHFSFNHVGSSLTVRYYPHSYSNTYGMRLMCWLW